MDNPIRIRSLGPLEILREGCWVSPSGFKARGVLAALLVNARLNVSTDDLVYELWGDEPPSSGRTLIRGYILSLRRLLGDSVIRQRAGGYCLDIAPEAVDACRFERLSDEGRRHHGRGEAEQSSLLLSQALSLWRGRVLADVRETALVAAYAERLGERRLITLEARIDSDLAQGRQSGLVEELRGLVAEHPFREGFTVLLMKTLHAAGRRAEALQVFADHRRCLTEELGLEPGPESQRVHQAVLACEPQVSAALAPVTPRPAQTPPDVVDFTGRDKEIAHWSDMLASGDHPALRTLALSGRAGVGKTSLSVHLAHRLRPVYPDGQLYAAFTAHTTPATVLGQFLRALGVPGSAIPEPLAERTHLYRSLLADRRVLVLLDNADSEAQVRALQPGSAGCTVVVTSRKRLLGLESAYFADLDVLEPDPAVNLLAKIVTAERVAREPEAALEIVELCGRLPLAVRIVGARATARPQSRLSAFAAELRDEASRLHRLKAGDLDVEAAIATSYLGLDQPRRHLLRLLGLLEVPSFPAWAAAALADVSERSAQESLLSLVDARLVDEVGTGPEGRARFRLHELIRIFARGRAEAEEDAGARLAALSRAFGGWLFLAEEAGARLPARTLAPLHAAAPRWRPRASEELVSDPFAWFEAEREAIAALVRQAAALGLAELSWGVAAAAQTFYELRDAHEGVRTHQVALAACRVSGARRGEAVMLRNLADLHAGKSGATLDDKLTSAEAALAIFRDLGERYGEADALYLAADAHRLRGDHDHAVAYLQESVDLARSHGYRLGELHALQQFAMVGHQRGRHDEALQYARHALVMAEELGSPRDECVVRGLLGVIHKRRGEFLEGGAQLRQATTNARAAADPLLEAQMLAHLGQLYVEEGHADARQTLERGLSLSAACHYDFGQAVALHGLGVLDCAEGHLAAGVAWLRSAAELWERLQNVFGKARTLAALGEAHARVGDQAAARHALTLACQEYRKLGNEQEADRISALIPHQP
ncbi:BTAD domain-containing putative transcriptional regulator [Streptosporangium sp. NPDC000396]|uniref:AfsR/SARP family transcriptional regulator n=1 Tax=Streptosporangium sp. NPDC000396 TaxID=3366185 RepID=UPI00369DD73F